MLVTVLTHLAYYFSGHRFESSQGHHSRYTDDLSQYDPNCDIKAGVVTMTKKIFVLNWLQTYKFLQTGYPEYFMHIFLLIPVWSTIGYVKVLR